MTGMLRAGEPPSPEPTMKQVADLAGVGTKTVSRVINGEPRVSEQTAQNVWAAIRALDYQVDMRAGSLRRRDRRTKSLGLLISSVDNHFAGRVHRGVEDVARARSVAVLAVSLDEDPQRELAAISELIQRRADGIIVGSTSTELSYPEATMRRIPMVFIDRRQAGLDADSVTSDNQAATAEATHRLVGRGHRRIALLTERLTIQTAAERYRGFAEGLARGGVALDESVVVTGLATPGEAECALARLLASERPPTAVVSTQNNLTIGALHALHAAGQQHRIALISFDDLPLADLLSPALTAIRQDARGLGRAAAERMFRRLDGEELPPAHVVIPTRLIERGSGEILPPA